jgi:uncharacterized protein YgiM (DUF1202 family)
MSDIDPIDVYDTAEDLCVDIGEGGDDTEDLEQYRSELRGEVTVLESGGFESVGGGFAGWVEPQGCSEGPTPGAKALLAYLLDRFPDARSMGIYDCRSSAANKKKWSEHAEGRAVDFGIPTSNSGKARPELGDPVVELLTPRAKELGIELLIYNRRAWSARTPRGRDYLKGPPHYDHVHIGLTPTAGSKLNYATVEAVLGGGGGGTATLDLPVVEGATHRVDVTTSLNVRSRPSTSGKVVGKLRDGTKVAAQSDSPQTGDGHEWIKIKAVTPGGAVEGWTATDFLVSLGTKPQTTGRSGGGTSGGASSGGTHVVVQAPSGLNVRKQPTTSADVVVKLPDGTAVTAQSGPAQKADGYQWIKVRASVGGRTQEGWVANKYLERVG